MVSLPAGKVIKTGLDLAAIDFFSLLAELKSKAFNGYLSITVSGYGGLEDGTLVFDNGKIVASFYDYLRYDQKLVGEAALARCFNASQAKVGVIDLYQLSNEQVQLILAFNEGAISIPSERDLARFKGQPFSQEYEKQLASLSSVETKSDLLKKYKLGDMSAETQPKPGLLEGSGPAFEEEDLLSKLKKKRGKTH
ncbi:MAG: DUF2226 domain-containing protein [Candidatus Micrarchaeota archaeon]